MQGVIENRSGLAVDDVISIANRVSNKKRNYLIMNKLQAKYLPVRPDRALDMFDALVSQCPDLEGNVIVIAFAEAATALGAEFTRLFSKSSKRIVKYVHTTRVRMNKPCYDCIEFKEEHSRAPEQLLYCNIDELKRADYILFLEDEITTGNTMVNCVKVLEELGIVGKEYIAISIFNCMDDEETKRFYQHGIEVNWLIKATKDCCEVSEPVLHYITQKQKVHSLRTPIGIYEYENDIQAICGKVVFWALTNVYESLIQRSDILVIGTEECMYPAIRAAESLRECGLTVEVTSITRVPVIPNKTILCKDKLKSLYGDYDTYIYNLRHHDTAIIVSDGDPNRDELKNLLWDKYGITKIYSITLAED